MKDGATAGQVFAIAFILFMFALAIGLLTGTLR